MQGNPPLPLATRESRGNGWAKKKPLEFHLFADDVNKNKRSDAAIYYVCGGTVDIDPSHFMLSTTNPFSLFSSSLSLSSLG